MAPANEKYAVEAAQLFSKLSIDDAGKKQSSAEEQSAAKVAAKTIAERVKADVNFLHAGDLIEKLGEGFGCVRIIHNNLALQDKNAATREFALIAVQALAEFGGQACEPYVLPTLTIVLERCADKAGNVREAAVNTGSALMAMVSPHAFKILLDILFDAMQHGQKWQAKQAALQFLGNATKSSPLQVRSHLPDIVPVVSEQMWDTKLDVKKAARECIMQVCQVVNNQDIDKFIPAVIECIADPTQVPECVHKLASTTFVKAVEAPALAIMVPLLVRGLGERNTAVMRQTSLIIDNMCKLVENPDEAELFLPKLLPGIERIIEIAANPELRQVAEKAKKTLLKARRHKDGQIHHEMLPKHAADHKVVLDHLKEFVVQFAKKTASLDVNEKFFSTTLDFVASQCSSLILHKSFQLAEWSDECVAPYLRNFMTADEAHQVAEAFMNKAKEEAENETKDQEDDDEGGEDLCNCEFSLAYGAMILLNNSRMRLKRGNRYGLCGPNGAGKTTLMRAIANGQVEGFPPADQLKTVFVEHNLQASEADLCVVDFICNDVGLSTTPREDIVEMLTSVGFDDELRAKSVGALSGGWKMKLELARAMLMQADILLLDEPTNHLDVKNVAWLTGYLTGLKTVTSMIVSHDPGFLDNVCTDILHYENRKLKNYRGNLSEFVAVVPEAKAYYTLEEPERPFKLPAPGFLEGVTSKDKAVLKLQRISFSYPGVEKPTVADVSLNCSLASRVACIGANGAGKSTLIRVITGETIPTTGEVWRHPNLRVAYVAQHAFHHLEQHLDSTPNQYIQWRYQFGEDKELLSKASRQLTEEEERIVAQKISIDGEKRLFENIIGRRKLKHTYEYEIKWVNLPYEQNTWLPRDKLEELGFEKIVQKFDDKEAARAGMYARPLTQVNVEKHLHDLGLDAEFSTHCRIRGLSGGQKVKVVIGAAMWLNPHLLVLDEPTNYLDRESLGALACAIKEFGGGVIMISHNSEFTQHLCPENWFVADGKVAITGNTYLIKEKVEVKAVETTVDAFGNVVKVKQPKKKLSRKEQKVREKVRAARKARGEDVSDSDDD